MQREGISEALKVERHADGHVEAGGHDLDMVHAGHRTQQGFDRRCDVADVGFVGIVQQAQQLRAGFGLHQAKLAGDVERMAGDIDAQRAVFGLAGIAVEAGEAPGDIGQLDGGGVRALKRDVEA